MESKRGREGQGEEERGDDSDYAAGHIYGRAALQQCKASCECSERYRPQEEGSRQNEEPYEEEYREELDCSPFRVHVLLLSLRICILYVLKRSPGNSVSCLLLCDCSSLQLLSASWPRAGTNAY